MRRSYHASKAAKEAQERPNTLPTTPVCSPPSTEEEGDTDAASSPSSPKPAEEGSGVRLSFGALRSVFERKDEVSHKIDEASVEASDKGRE